MNDSPRQPGLTEARLEALLDEALSADAAAELPPDLAQRIVDRTAADLTAPHRGARARLHQPWVLKVAAVVVLTASLSLVLTALSIVREAQSLINLDRQLQQVAAFTPAAQPIDQDLALLALQIHQYSTADAWDSARFHVDLSLSEYELELNNAEWALF